MDPAIKDALKAIVEALRQSMPDPASLPDYGFDPGFLERTAPALEFLWSALLPRAPARSGKRACQRGGASGLPTTRAACPTMGHAHLRLPRASSGAQTAASAGRDLRRSISVDAARWWRASGGVRASMRNALDLCQRGPASRRFPEGLRGVGKPYRER